MKKLTFSITLLLLAAFVITACSSTPPAAPTATVGAAPTVAASPAASQTGAATAAATTSATAAATGAATTGATAAATGAATTAATAGATSAATTAATSAATTAATTAATAAATGAATTAATGTGTPAAMVTTPQVTGTQTANPVVSGNGTPAAGVSGQFVRLSILLQSSLTTSGETGKITGVVLGQPNMSVNTGAATATPAAGQAQVPVPYVRYVIANMSGASGSSAKEILLPWQMFSFTTTSTSGGLTSQNFTLNGTAASRANVPQVSLPSQTGVLQTGWDTQLSQYWASQGFNIPVTGAGQQSETDVLLRNTVNGTNVVDQNKQVFGQVADFLVDPANGQFVYAVFNGGQALGNRSFIVPVRFLAFQLSSANASGLGNVQINIPSTILNTAPSIDLNQLMQNPALLQQIITFWQSIQNTTK